MKFTIEESEQLCVSLRDLIDRDTDAIRREEQATARRAFEVATNDRWPASLDQWHDVHAFISPQWMLKSVGRCALNQHASSQIVTSVGLGVVACVLTEASAEEIAKIEAVWAAINASRASGKCA